MGNIFLQNPQKFHLVMLEAHMFPTPTRSNDINQIENFFHFIQKELNKDALQQNITKETLAVFILGLLYDQHILSILS